MPLAHAARPHGVLVTGAAGFIGARIVRRLLIDGFPVVAVVRSNAPDRVHRLQSLLSRGPDVPLHLAVCDLHDSSALHSMVEDLSPTTCIHAAWEVQHTAYRNDPNNQRWVQTSLRLFDALRSVGCEWMGVLGTCIEPKRDQRPICRYAGAKATLRHRMMDIAGIDSGSNRAMHVCWWKVFQPYGPGELPTRLIPSVIESLLRRRPIELQFPDDVRDFIHVDDIGSAVSASLAARLAGVFELGTGTGHSIAQAALMIAERLNAMELVFRANAGHMQATELVAHPQPLISASQWRPETTMIAGVDALIESARRVHKAIA